MATVRGDKTLLNGWIKTTLYQRVVQHVSSNDEVSGLTHFLKLAVKQFLNPNPVEVETEETRTLRTEVREKTDRIAQLEKQIQTLQKPLETEQNANAENRKLLLAAQANINYLSKPWLLRVFQKRPLSLTS